MLVANPDQFDSNADGIGNICDADITGDGFVNFGDLAAFKASFFPNFNADADFNNDGGVNFGDLAIIKETFNGPAGPSAANCGPVDQGLPADEAFGAEMFLRGNLYSDWGAESPGNNFENQGDGIYIARIAMYAGDYEFKVADGDWTIERTNFIDDPLILDTPLQLLQPLGTNDNNGLMNVPADGCFNLSMDTSDTDNPQITMAEVAGDCGVADQGLDNAEAFGLEMFMRGAFEGWSNPPPASSKFLNFGDNVYQAEFEILAGSYPYKIASGDWTVQRSSVLRVLEPGTTITVVDSNLGGTNTAFSAPEDGCYVFELDVSGGIESPTITATQQ